MNKKLTLSLDANIVDFAHDYSKKAHKPISKIIEGYFSELKMKNTPEIPKEVAELYGILEGINVPDKKELRRKFHEDHLN
ncbi:MAG: DUF6364 family protein [Spirochaetaceae bacterium]|jgi:hypothetical protein|nr:DUF6364 family protein [Spirochaetaceae bacterium]